MIIQSYLPGGANSTRTGESCWALPCISSYSYFCSVVKNLICWSCYPSKSILVEIPIKNLRNLTWLANLTAHFHGNLFIFDSQCIFYLAK